MLMERGYTIQFKYRALLVCVIFATLTYGSRNFHLDDSLIYARYISNALHGNGLVFNRGEPVNALTSVLDTWLQLGLSWLLGGRVILAQTILGGSLFLLCGLIAETVVPFSGLVLAGSSLFYFCSGMETSLFLLCLVLCVAAYVHDKIEWLPTLCVLAILARFEGGLLVLVIGWRLWRQRRFPSLISFLPALFPIAIFLVINLHFYHHLLPQSTTAKLGQGRSGYWGRWPMAFLSVKTEVTRPLGTERTYLPILTILACFGAALPGARKHNEILGPFLVLLACFYVLLNIPSYYWYFAPFVYFLTIYAARQLPDTKAAVWSLLFVVVLMTRAGYIDLNNPKYLSTDYMAASAWMNQHVPENATIATVETGTIGWYTNRNIIDIIGLTTPINAQYTAHSDYSSWIKEHPDYVIVHLSTPFPWELAAVSSPDYVLLPTRFHDIGIMQRRSSPYPVLP